MADRLDMDGWLGSIPTGVLVVSAAMAGLVGLVSLFLAFGAGAFFVTTSFFAVGIGVARHFLAPPNRADETPSMDPTLEMSDTSGELRTSV